MVCHRQGGEYLMAIFPQEDKVDSTSQELQFPQTIITDRGINHLFDFNTGEFVLIDGKPVEVVGDAGVIFWIEKNLRTELENPMCYRSTGFGSEIENYIGSVLPTEILQLELENSIKTTLLQHERIRQLSNFKFTRDLDYGIMEFEVELNAITIIDQDGTLQDPDTFTRFSTLEQIQDFISTKVKLLDANRLLFKTSIGNQVYVKID